MPLTVLQVAYPFAPVGTAAVGGAERVLGDLDEALVASGEGSIVVACEGSTPAGELFATPLPESRLDDVNELWQRKRFQAVIDRALQSRRVDIVHMHGLSFHECVLPRDLPVVVTLHMPIDWYPRDLWAKLGRNVYPVCVSESQRRTCPPELAGVRVIPNGVALPAAVEAPREDFALVLGRVCPEKNMHEALDAGSRAGVRVLIGGQVFPYAVHQRYFDEQIVPRLRDGHEFLGPLNAERLTELLARSRCLLHPTLAPETSSLVAMEAMAAGTPVIAYRSGALPEVIEDGKTGLLVNDMDAMATALHSVLSISSAVCRDTARQRFSLERMTARYMALYRWAAAEQRRRYA